MGLEAGLASGARGPGASYEGKGSRPVRPAWRRRCRRRAGAHRSWIKSARAVLVALAALAVPAGCGPAPDPLAPPEIRYGEDVCAQCNMIISEPRFAAGLVVAVDGEPTALAFDDVGELVAYEAEHPDQEVLRRYVHDFETESWLAAEEATFVRSVDIRSPMGHGLAAFTAAGRAAEVAAETGGQALSYAEMVRAVGMDNH